MSAALNQAPQSSTTKLWPVLSLIFMLLWLITSYLLWKKHQLVPTDTQQDKTKQLNLSAQLKQIKQACRANDAKAARQAIIAWAHAQGFVSMASLEQVATLIDSIEFKQALQELDYTLYSSTGNSAWQGEFLWQLIRNYKPPKENTASSLQPLYPS